MTTRKIKVSTFARGRSRKYAPRTPEIAPDAPRFGMPAESGAVQSVIDRLEGGRGVAGEQIEDEVAHAAERVLDVVAEDPEEEHVAGEVDEAAVHEERR